MNIHQTVATQGVATEALFIADLHLQPVNDATQRLAMDFLQHIKDATTLYILGDLFEYWIGDDAGVHAYQAVVTALRHLTDRQCNVLVMHGNRDFLLGSDFAAASGVQLVTRDHIIVEMAGKRVLLLHGDTLCTDDIDYQAMRRLVRGVQWQEDFLNQSIKARHELAAELRQRSREAGSGKSSEIMDVNDDAVLQALNEFDCDMIVHGHTHRPDVHTVDKEKRKRFVVGDWHPDHAMYLHFDGSHFQLRRFNA